MDISQTQRAALDSAGQLMFELASRADAEIVSFHAHIADAWPDKPFVATGNFGGRILSGVSSATLPEAFDSLIAKRDTPPKIESAREAVEAMRELLDPQDPLRAKLDELPIA
jgi:hypothetical protein